VREFLKTRLDFSTDQFASDEVSLIRFFRNGKNGAGGSTMGSTSPFVFPKDGSSSTRLKQFSISSSGYFRNISQNFFTENNEFALHLPSFAQTGKTEEVLLTGKQKGFTQISKDGKDFGGSQLREDFVFIATVIPYLENDNNLSFFDGASLLPGNRRSAFFPGEASSDVPALPENGSKKDASEKTGSTRSSLFLDLFNHHYDFWKNTFDKKRIANTVVGQSLRASRPSLLIDGKPGRAQVPLYKSNKYNKNFDGLKTIDLDLLTKKRRKISSLQFEHGELRFVQDLKKKKLVDYNTEEPVSSVFPIGTAESSSVFPPTRAPLIPGPNEAGIKSSETKEKAQTNKKSVRFALQSLNLRTTDIRLYKKSLDCSEKITISPVGSSHPSGKGQTEPYNSGIIAKIGDLIRVGDEIEKSFGVDKTTQIIRRTAYGLVMSKETGSQRSVLPTGKFTSSAPSLPEQGRKHEAGNASAGNELANKAIFYSLRRVHPYLISNHSPLAVSHGDIVEARQFLFELFYQQSKTGDIVQGLPKIEQLFEARRTSIHVIETIHVRLKEKFQELCNEYPLYEAARLSIRFIQRILIDEIQLVYQSQGVDIADKHIEIIVRQMTSKVIIHEKGKSPFFPDDIIDFHQIGQFELELSGLTNPNRPTSVKSNERVEFALSKHAQSPFGHFLNETSNTSQQSLQSSYVAIECFPASRKEGREELSSAELGRRLNTYASTINIDSVSSSGIVFEPIVLGLTKIAFLTQSFVSAASFQETKRVLMNSALQSRVDFLYGLKENVIVGRFIRAGTGFRTSLFPSA
jgi:hypothetical protein